MREIGQETVPTSEIDKETFLSLRLAEPSERVKITLDERMLSIEGKRNATIDMRLNAIATMKHHSTNLVPTWLILLGLALIWIGYRVMVPPTYKLTFISIGVALIAARFLTKKPTLTVQTSSGDTHVLYGSERALNRLSFMFNHLANNKSMAEVRAKLQAIETELDGGWRDVEVLPAPVLPTVLDVPQAVNIFLSDEREEMEQNAVVEPAPDWMPTNEPEPAYAPPVVGFISSFQPVTGSPEPIAYPPDHRPAPLTRPVLVPAPPMHQGAYDQGQPTFFPSFINQDGAHIPGLREEPETEEEAEEMILDAELFEALDDAIEPGAEPVQIPTVAPQPQRETLLKPKTRKSIEDSSFKPRRTEALHPRRGRRSGFISRIRETSSDILERTSNIGRPRPFSTSDTSGALREQAAEAAAQTTPEVHRSLSQERGGVLSAEETERLRQRSEQLLAAAAELQAAEKNTLESLSFGDLRASSNDDGVKVPRLDEE